MTYANRKFLCRFLPAYPVILLISLIVECTPVISDDHCVWYGVCDKTTFRQTYCAYNGKAKPIQAPEMVIMEKYCPDIAKGGLSCCNYDQLQTLHFEMLANILQSTACMENYMKHVCGKCSPRQSAFLNPIKVEPYNSTYYQVKEVDYYIGGTYMEDTFKSCLDVKLVNENETTMAMDIMCGEYGKSQCTPQRLFAFMGNWDNNPFVPFQVNFRKGDEPVDGFTPFNPTTTS